MKCTECPEYRECVKHSNLAIKRKSCPKAKVEKQLTNADRIRAMTDEELALFICHRMDCYGSDCPGKQLCHPGNNGLVAWLKQPAEVGDG